MSCWTFCPPTIRSRIELGLAVAFPPKSDARSQIAPSRQGEAAGERWCQVQGRGPGRAGRSSRSSSAEPQRLAHESGFPALLYTWIVDAILLDTTPRTMTGWEQRRAGPRTFASVEATNAWDDDDRRAEYILECTLLDVPPKSDSAHCDAGLTRGEHLSHARSPTPFGGSSGIRKRSTSWRRSRRRCGHGVESRLHRARSFRG